MDEAQHNRFDYCCRKLLLKPGDRLIEVGTAWGYMAILAAEKYGADVTNYGIVPEQNRVFEEEIKKRGLRNVRNVVKDHRELVNEPNTYDKYVSLGVYEHSGQDCHEEWIKSIATALKPGGIGLLSFLSHMRRQPMEFLFEKYLYPGAYVPSLSQTLILLEKYDLSVVDIESLRYHYFLALDAWYKRFMDNWEEIHSIDPKRFDEHFRRTWTMYLAGGAETLREEDASFMDVSHIVFTKGRSEKYYPVDREFLYEDEVLEKQAGIIRRQAPVPPLLKR